MSRPYVILFALAASPLLSRAGEGTGGALWKMSAEALPVHEGRFELLGRCRRPSLASVALYPEILVGVRDLKVAGAEGKILPWRLEGPGGTRIATAGGELEGPSSGIGTVRLVFPYTPSVRITAFRRRQEGVSADALEPVPGGGVRLRWFALKHKPPRDFQFDRGFIKRFLEGEKPFADQYVSGLWLTEPPQERPDQFVVQADAWLWIPSAGSYCFALDADDAAMMRVETKTGAVVAFKPRCGMFAGLPAWKSRVARLEPGLCRVTVVLVEDVGAQGFVPYWQPPWAERPVPLRPEYLVRSARMRVTAYRPLAEGVPAHYLQAVRLADFALEKRTGGARRALFRLVPVPALGEQRYLYHEGAPLLSSIAPDGVVEARDVETGSLVAARRLEAAPAPPVGQAYDTDLAVRLRSVLSSPVHFARETLTVDFRWEVLSRPALRREFLPLRVRVAERSRGSEHISNLIPNAEGNVTVEVPLEEGDCPVLTSQVLLGGLEVAREQVSVVPVDRVIDMAAETKGNPPFGLEDGKLYVETEATLPAREGPQRQVVVVLARRLTAGEKRRWRPVKVAHSGLRPAGRLIVFSGGAKPAERDLEGLVSIPAETNVSADRVLGPAEVLRQILVAEQDFSGAAVLLYTGGKAATGLLSRFAYERVLSASLYVLRRRRALRVLLVEEGPMEDLAARIARNWQVGVHFLKEGNSTEWSAPVRSLGPWW